MNHFGQYLIVFLSFFSIHALAQNSHSTVIDDFELSPGQNAEPSQILVATSGKIFVVGGADISKKETHWIVRMKSREAQNWQMSADLSAPSGYAHADSIAQDVNGDISMSQGPS